MLAGCIERDTHILQLVTDKYTLFGEKFGNSDKKIAILICTVATIEAMKVKYFTALSIKVLKEHVIT